MIEDIIKQNYIIEGLIVERLVQKRLGRVRIGEKVKLLLIIGVQTEEVANTLFNRGLFLGGDHYLVARHKITFLVTQCFKCQGFSYIAKNCRREARYGRCAKQHNTSDCTGDLSKKCFNCKVGYKAQSGVCSVKRTQQEKAAVIRAFTSIYYASAYKAPISEQQSQSQYEIITKEALQWAKKRKLKETTTRENSVQVEEGLRKIGWL